MFNRLAAAQLELAQPEAAQPDLEAALARDPADFPALLNAGQIAGKLGRYEDAAQHLHNAVGARPDDPKGWYFLGLAHSSTGARAEATNALQRCIELADADSPLRDKARKILAAQAP